MAVYIIISQINNILYSLDWQEVLNSMSPFHLLCFFFVSCYFFLVSIKMGGNIVKLLKKVLNLECKEHSTLIFSSI